MARYVTLLRFTEQGAKNLKKSPSRADAFSKAAAKAGVKVESQLWTVGQYDGLLVLQADKEADALKCIASLEAAGNVKTESMQAFDARDFATVVG